MSAELLKAARRNPHFHWSASVVSMAEELADLKKKYERLVTAAGAVVQEVER